METVELLKKPPTKKQQVIPIQKQPLDEPSLTEFSVFNLCAETGVLVFSGFMAYFLIMRSIGLHEVFTLRYVNALFLIAGISLAVLSYKKNMKGVINYKKGLQMGAFITLMAVVPFTFFIYLYLNIDDGFLSLIEKDVKLR